MREILHVPRLALLLCVTGACVLGGGGIAVGMANHEGWPQIAHHQGHPNNESGVMHGQLGVHNMLLGGNGNDTIWAGNEGDVIWGDSHPGGQRSSRSHKVIDPYRA
jgi:hypothetical protein